MHYFWSSRNDLQISILNSYSIIIECKNWFYKLKLRSGYCILDSSSLQAQLILVPLKVKVTPPRLTDVISFVRYDVFTGRVRNLLLCPVAPGVTRGLGLVAHRIFGLSKLLPQFKPRN